MASATPPPGAIPHLPSNLPPDEDRQASFLAMLFATIGIATIVLALRLFVRIKIRSLGTDDWLMLAAWLLWVGNAITGTLYCVAGGTRHIFYITDLMTVMNILKYNYMNEVIGSLAPVVGKLSVGAMIIRLMERGSHKKHKILLIGFMTIHAIMAVILVILLTVQCNPPAAIWDKSILTATCWGPAVIVNYSIVQGALGTFLDFFLALSPIPIIWPLALSLQKKIALCGLLSLGVFTGICAAVKTYELKEISNSDDPTWGTYDLYMWSDAEVFLVVVCGSIPALKPLYESLVHGTSISPSNVPRKPHYSSSHLNGSSSKNTKNHYMLDSRGTNSDLDTEYLAHGQAVSEPEDSFNRSGIQHTQTYEVKVHDRV